MSEGGQESNRSGDLPHPNDATVFDGAAHGGSSITNQVGPSKVKRIIGSGSVGTVVLARQENLKRDVTIKIMNPGVVSKKVLRRFEFWTHKLARLRHLTIAQVYEAGTDDDGTVKSLA